jgi:hypothetical protein
LRRQIEDIVFHDPGRHDQDRLGAHLRRRRVLDEFDQAIAKDNLSGRDRDVASNLERFGADWLSARRQPMTVFPEIKRAANEIDAAQLLGLCDKPRDW